MSDKKLTRSDSEQAIDSNRSKVFVMHENDEREGRGPVNIENGVSSFRYSRTRTDLNKQQVTYLVKGHIRRDILFGII